MDDVLFQAGICQGVDPDSARVLEGLLKPVEFRREALLYAEGQPGDLLYVLTEGKVRICHTEPDGRENTLMVAGPSDMVGSLAMFDPGPRTASAVALTDVSALSMDRDALRSWIRSCPEISERLLRVLARRLRRTNSMLSDMIFTDVPGRVAKALLMLAHRFGNAEDGLLLVEHDLTQAELASLVGSSRETVNKALSDFSDRGWLRLEQRSVLILEPGRLARRAR